MFPYVTVPDIHVGPFTFHVFGALVMIGVLTGWFLVERRMPGETSSRLLLWMMIGAFLGAHLAKVSRWEDIWRVWDGLYSFGGIVGGLLGCFACTLWYRIPHYIGRFLDAVAYCFPFAWSFGRLGCALVHDHPGRRTDSWLGVAYPDGTRFDLGLVEFLFMLLLAGLFWLLDRRKRLTGFYFGWFLVIYGVFRFWLDSLHENPGNDRWFAVTAVGAGAAVFVWGRLQSAADFSPPPG
jgi:phosphatidylglycerol:prolipoprotein diacylglycerol transferase